MTTLPTTKHALVIQGSVSTKNKRGGDNGKRKPTADEDGLLWCNCTKPNLTHNAGGRGQALCLRCGTPWYH